MFATVICAKSVTSISANRVREQAAIGCTERPGAGDPRVNIQSEGRKAIACQVRQVLGAIDRLEVERGV